MLWLVPWPDPLRPSQTVLAYVREWRTKMKAFRMSIVQGVTRCVAGFAIKIAALCALLQPVAISNGCLGPPLSKGRSSGCHSRKVRVSRECSSEYASNPPVPQFTGVRTLRVVAVCAARDSRLARRCCGGEFPPKQACAGILAEAGNRASLWGVMRSRLLIYPSNILRTVLTKENWRPRYLLLLAMNTVETYREVPIELPAPTRVLTPALFELWP